MARLGMLIPAFTGHLNPATTLGRALKQRGHDVMVLTQPDGVAAVKSAGLAPLPILAQDFPEGRWRELSTELGRRAGVAAFSFTIEWIRQMTVATLRELTTLLRNPHFDGLVIDQIMYGAESVCESARLPFVVACNALPLHIEPSLPLHFLNWRYSKSAIAHRRNAFMQAILLRTANPVFKAVHRFRTSAGLPGQHSERLYHAVHALAHVTQLPAVLDFPRERLQPNVHHTGPWFEPRRTETDAFPWEKLDGRPLVYASMGTLQNRRQQVFETIAQACAGLGVQLVLSLGGRDQTVAEQWPGDPIVVRYAPQSALLSRARLFITHAGLNSALESLAYGVPMVAIPVTNDQPGVAARLAYAGVAEVLPVGSLTAGKLRLLVKRALTDESRRRLAQRFEAHLRQLDGVSRAADICDEAFATRQPVLRRPPTPRPTVPEPALA